jgi:hypothetical protein
MSQALQKTTPGWGGAFLLKFLSRQFSLELPVPHCVNVMGYASFPHVSKERCGKLERMTMAELCEHPECESAAVAVIRPTAKSLLGPFRFGGPVASLAD